MTPDTPRLIEVDFPLEQVSLDAVHEKTVRHGHISTLHVWPARRPLAACRAALVATLLPDPGDPDKRKDIWRRLAGEVVETETSKGKKRQTRGGVLHWGREDGPDLGRFREMIRAAYGGRAPRVLDPFAGGGAIPLEAMRLGCEATAMDINPVAWFILKCTLDYPHRLAGETLPLPDFARRDVEFMEAFLKAKGIKGKNLVRQLALLGLREDSGDPELALPEVSPADVGELLEADLAWQLRAWGRHVLTRARAQLAQRYPVYAEFQALSPNGQPFKVRPLKLLKWDRDGRIDENALNKEYSEDYLADRRNPRWVAKPTVAYLWARTVTCKGCRAVLPLLKTRWLCKKPNKRVLLTLTPKEDCSGVVFGVETDVPQFSGSAPQRLAHDKRLGGGTMSRSGARCPCCQSIMTMEDIRLEGRTGRLGADMTAVVVEGPKGKEYRLPEDQELCAAEVAHEVLEAFYANVPFEKPEEPLPGKEALGFRIPLYGFDRWRMLFTNRQLLSLGTFVKEARRISELTDTLPIDWRRAIIASTALCVDRLADYSSTICAWQNGRESMGHTFARFALPIVWDYVEVNPLSDTTGNFLGALGWISRVIEHLKEVSIEPTGTEVLCQSATDSMSGEFDVICTDPPYYDAIPYSDLMDFFHVWLRRTLSGILPEADDAFARPLGPKWDHESGVGELIDDAGRFGGDKELSKQTYEDGMARAFESCRQALKPEGRLVVVFANKSPDAWETLVAALIRAGFIVTGSWPIQTEMQSRQRAMASAALASSVWLVCRKRPAAGPGWDSAVLSEMRDNITRKLRGFWDAGIRGPDFVWSATGPALEAFSKYPAVKKADEPGAFLTVSEFLREARRMVVDFVVGRVLNAGGDAGAASGLDDVTLYYLLHRSDFSLDEAPAGACILYAISCNLSDRDLSELES